MKHAIVMGASSGIGREVAKLLLEEGWSVGLAARRTEPMEEMRKVYPDLATVMCIDITADDAPARLLQLVETMGGVQLYLHASGIGKQNRQLEAGIEARTIATNVAGFASMIDTMFGYMAAHGGGHIAVISSVAGTKGLGPAAAYSASKAFQSTYIQALEQLSNSRKLGISFTDIRPGFVDTDLLTGDSYPMLMQKGPVARQIVRAIGRRRHVCVIDWRYRALVFLWRRLPNWLWRRVRFAPVSTLHATPPKEESVR
ncbi:SDR family NAD(P)-dependent oxidoreductase [Hoylesella oralis]|nr:SDR family NAD(P)-dependent oxidoreductase [Hoylesella oralis]EPH18718.1 hypothetical protein HMPREF1475_00626 [Hoylesella oralis HGA0225]SHF76928.1 Short-chain dehydrogenase [Hoylesella oralis]